jgi:hypothetical protein
MASNNFFYTFRQLVTNLAGGYAHRWYVLVGVDGHFRDLLATSCVVAIKRCVEWSSVSYTCHLVFAKSALTLLLCLFRSHIHIYTSKYVTHSLANTIKLFTCLHFRVQRRIWKDSWTTSEYILSHNDCVSCSYLVHLVYLPLYKGLCITTLTLSFPNKCTCTIEYMYCLLNVSYMFLAYCAILRKTSDHFLKPYVHYTIVTMAELQSKKYILSRLVRDNIFLIIVNNFVKTHIWYLVNLLVWLQPHHQINHTNVF